MQIPFIIEETFSEIVFMNIESNLLGITFAVLTPFDVLIETVRAPILSLSSVKATKHPF